jgi:hypothetical protein
MPVPLFQCSACSAPLVPKGSSAIIACPYCGASVVVPEELRQAAEPRRWSTRLFDNFSATDNNWLLGNQPSDYFTKLNQTIADGRYRWDAQVGLASSITTAWLLGHHVSDFHLVVNCKHIRGSRAGSAWGVIFRIQDNHNYYCLRLTDAQFFAVSANNNRQWLNIVDWKATDTIKPNGVNQVEVIAHATHFTFLINGQIVSEIDDDRFTQGFVGLAIEGYTPGEETTFDFLDLILRAP